jgi:hypothetical protein
MQKLSGAAELRNGVAFCASGPAKVGWSSLAPDASDLN